MGTGECGFGISVREEHAMRASSATADGLQRRLVTFAVAVCKEARRMPRDVVTDHVAKQIVRSSTSPAACYAEARAAESRTDFVHKMQICLKELRETAAWLAFIEEFAAGKLDSHLRQESQELVRIFATSVRTARARPAERPDKSPVPSPQSQVPTPDSPVPSPQS